MFDALLDPMHQDSCPWSDATHVSRDADLATILSQALYRGVHTFALHGDDAFVGRVLTTYHHALRTHAVEPSFAIMALDDPSARLARSLGVTASPAKRKRELERALAKDRARPTRVPTLRVASSHLPRAQFGFSMGTGLLFEMFEAGARLGRAGSWGKAATTWLTERFASEAATQEATTRLVVDAVPSSQTDFTLLSVLPKTWFELAMGRQHQLTMRRGDGAATLIRALAQSRAPLRGLQGGADVVERATLDQLEGYVLDGELITPQDPFVLQVTQGPTFRLLS